MDYTRNFKNANSVKEARNFYLSPCEVREADYNCILKNSQSKTANKSHALWRQLVVRFAKHSRSTTACVGG